MNNRCHVVVRLGFVLAMLSWGWGARCDAQSGSVAAEAAANRRLQRVMAEAAVKLEKPFVMLGSWVSGKKYSDPLAGGTSDHDMRLLLPKKLSPDGRLVELTQQEALAEWKKAQETVKTLVRQEFGKDADAVLKTVNMYPPSQLMRNVNDAEEAYAQFRKLGVVPSLSQVGEVGGEVDAKVAEGLYGRGAGVWTQEYERTAGQVVYPVVTGIDPATQKPVVKAFTGMTDLTRLEEGYARYTPGGMGNTSLQWVGHAEEAIASGDGKKVAKYLTRLEGDLAKGRDLIGMGPSGPWREEIHALMKTLEGDPGRLSAVKAELAAVLERARLQSAILAKMGEGTTVRNEILAGMLKAVEDGRQLSRALMEAAGKVPLEQVLDGLMVYALTVETSRAAGESDPAAALVSVAGFLSPLTAGLLAQLTSDMLTAAKDAGYDLMAGRQQAFDLLDGIYTAGGRESVDGRHYSLDQLVRKYAEGDEEKIRSFVYALCLEASKRDLGAATGQADNGVAEAMLVRVYPVILRAWKAKREELTVKFLTLRDRYLGKGLQLSYAPAIAIRDAKTSEIAVTVSPGPILGKYDDELSGMRDLLAILYGAGNYFVDVEDEWSPEGKEAQNGISQIFTYVKDDRYTVTMKRRLRTGGPGIPASSPVTGENELKASVDIDVGLSPIVTFENLPVAEGYTEGLTVAAGALVERLPSGLTKIAYRWIFGETKNRDKEMNSITAYTGPIADAIRVTAPPYTYTTTGRKNIRLQIFDSGAQTFDPVKSTPIADKRYPIVVNKVTIPGPWVLGFTLNSGFTEKDVNYPYFNIDNWDSPGLASTVPTEVSAAGTFTFDLDTIPPEAAKGRSFRKTISGSGRITGGEVTVSGVWARSRDFKTYPWIENKIAHITQYDSGTFSAAGTLKRDKDGKAVFASTRVTGTFETKETVVWLKDDGSEEKTETFTGKGLLSNSSAWRMFPKE